MQGLVFHTPKHQVHVYRGEYTPGLPDTKDLQLEPIRLNVYIGFLQNKEHAPVPGRQRVYSMSTLILKLPFLEKAENGDPAYMFLVNVHFIQNLKNVFIIGETIIPLLCEVGNLSVPIAATL